MEVRAITLALHPLPPCGVGVFMTVENQGGGKRCLLLQLHFSSLPATKLAHYYGLNYIPPSNKYLC